MNCIRALGKTLCCCIALELLIALFLRASWQPLFHQGAGLVLAACLILTILQYCLGEAAPEVLWGLSGKVLVAAFVVVAIAAALSFSIDQFAALLS